MSKVCAAPVALGKEVGKPKVSACRFLSSLLKESVQGRVKLRQELADSRAEMKGNRMSPEDVIREYQGKRGCSTASGFTLFEMGSLCEVLSRRGTSCDICHERTILASVAIRLCRGDKFGTRW